MTKQGFIQRHPRLTLLGAFLFTLLVGLGLVEGALKLFFPYTVATIGHQHAENAKHYGWGFDPHEGFLNQNPDTKEVYYGLLNNHGWRDRDREYAKPPGVFRIVALGDSVTFGAITPEDKTYTRILEDKLRADGFAVEVINISTPGWGTDTQLEAFRREGKRYSPDLVVVQFTDNDLSDNQSLGVWRKRKPFLYELDDAGALVRRKNPDFTGNYWSFRQRREAFLNNFEIHKRLRGLYLGLKYRFQPRHELSPSQVSHILHEIAPAPDGFVRWLHENQGRPVEESIIRAQIEAHGLDHQREIILRLAEKQHFHGLWPGYRDSRVVTSSPQWLLFRRLMEAIRDEARAAGAATAVLSEREEGLFAWAAYWRFFEDTPHDKALFLDMTDAVHAFARKNGIAVIDTPLPVPRARDDQHPNIEGNEALAENVRRWLAATYGDRLPRLP